jgi:hypothetical protein
LERGFLGLGRSKREIKNYQVRLLDDNYGFILSELGDYAKSALYIEVFIMTIYLVNIEKCLIMGASASA